MSTPLTEASLSLEERKAARRARRFDHADQRQTAATTPEEEQQLIGRVEQDNPIFKVFEDRQLSQEDKIRAIAKLLQFDEKEPDNDKKIEILSEFFEYVQLQRRNMALGQISTVSDQAYATFKQNMDSVFEELNNFKGSLAPLDEVLGLLKKFRGGDGNKRSVIEQINEAFRQQKMLKESRQSREADVANLNVALAQIRMDRSAQLSIVNQNDTFFGRLLRGGLIRDAKAKVLAFDAQI